MQIAGALETVDVQATTPECLILHDSSAQPEVSVVVALALDETAHRIYVACRKPPALLVLDTRSGKAAKNASGSLPLATLAKAWQHLSG